MKTNFARAFDRRKSSSMRSNRTDEDPTLKKIQSSKEGSPAKSSLGKDTLAEATAKSETTDDLDH